MGTCDGDAEETVICSEQEVATTILVFVSSLLCLCLWPPPLSSLLLRSFELLSQVCPLENDNSTLLVVLGGETAESGENKHSTSIEVMKLILMLILMLMFILI